MKKKRQILLRIDTKANWLKANPTLGKGEMVIIEDLNNSIVVGDGATEFKKLKIQGYDGNIAKELGISDDKVISQRVVTEELGRRLERVELSNIVEGVKITRPEEPVTTPGKLVYDKTSKLFLWEVTYSGVTEKAYFTNSSIEELAGTSPKVGAVYILGDAVYVGIADGLLSGKFMSIEEVNQKLDIQDEKVNQRLDTQDSDIKSYSDSLQAQIDKIVAGNTRLGVSSSLGSFFEGESKSVTITASLSSGKGTISIYRGRYSSGTLVKTADSVSSLSFTETINTTTSYYATAKVTGGTVNGNQVSANAYKPFYVGAGKRYQDVLIEKFKHGPTSTPRGTYSFTAAANDKVYIIVPNNMSVSGVKFVEGGFGLPVALSQTETLDGYKIYASEERSAGNYNIEVY